MTLQVPDHAREVGRRRRAAEGKIRSRQLLFQLAQFLGKARVHRPGPHLQPELTSTQDLKYHQSLDEIERAAGRRDDSRPEGYDAKRDDACRLPGRRANFE
jgi:hypothetical protein